MTTVPSAGEQVGVSTGTSAATTGFPVLVSTSATGGPSGPVRCRSPHGWIDRALPAAELDPFVAQLARRIAAEPPADVAAAVAAIDAALPARPDSAELEMALLMPLFTGADAIERAAAALAAGAQTVAGERDLEGLIERATS
ncbi:hypothetical protein [Nocardia jiangsuensis]|uniref:Uncharacterized protein n=1 Tax=Nocardia jiangsuensis TaxID=1691563 RepID=A0ABV8DZ15_9NOCA